MTSKSIREQRQSSRSKRVAIPLAVLLMLALMLQATRVRCAGSELDEDLCGEMREVFRGATFDTMDALAFASDVGVCYHSVGSLEKAHTALEHAEVIARAAVQRDIAATEPLARVLYNLAVVHRDQRDIKHFLSFAKEAVSVLPSLAAGHIALASYFEHVHNFEEALVHLHALNEMEAGDTEDIHYRIGKACVNLRRYDEAVQWFLSLPMNETHAVKLALADVYLESGNVQGAIVAYKDVLQEERNHLHALNGLLMAKRRTAQWASYGMLQARVKDRIFSEIAYGKLPTLTALEASFLDLDFQTLSTVARRKSISRMQTLREAVGYQGPMYSPLNSLSNVVPHIAYIVHKDTEYWMHHIAQLFACHKRKEILFSLYIVDGVAPLPPVALRPGAVYRAIDSRNPVATAQRIVDDGVHVLIALEVSEIRIELEQILSLNPVEFTVALMQQPISPGATISVQDRAIHFLLTDTFLTPDALDKAWEAKITERLLVLPCAFIPRFPLAVVPLKEEDHAFRMPTESFIFGCFGKLENYDPESFGAWITILVHSPESVLVLDIPEDAGVRDNLLSRASSIGFEEHHRIVFVPSADPAVRLSWLQEVDLFLDTWARSSIEAVLDALNLSVPVLTKVGVHFSARYSGSLLHMSGLRELVTSTPHEYVRRAVELYNSPVLLTRIKRLTTHPIPKPNADEAWLSPCAYATMIENACARVLEEVMTRAE